MHYMSLIICWLSPNLLDGIVVYILFIFSHKTSKNNQSYSKTCINCKSEVKFPFKSINLQLILNTDCYLYSFTDMKALLHKTLESLFWTRQVSSMIHLAKPTASPVATIVFCCFVLLDLKSGTDNMCENNYHYRPWVWVGRVDQLSS